MKPLDCIIVDDDEINRLTVVSYAKKISSLNIVGVFENAENALQFLEFNKVTIAFLDIELDGLSGIELRNQALKIPVCVFISSHFENAAETFDIKTLDFIVKPFKFSRFEQTMTRILEYIELQKKAALFESIIGGDTIYVKSGHDQIKVKLYEILYLEALKNYTLLVTENKRHCVSSNIGELLQNSNFNSFVRVHRSFAVQKQYIQKIGTQELELSNGTTIAIGRSYKDFLSTII